MGPFPPSFSNLYIFLTVDYVSKWVEPIPTRTNDASMVPKVLHEHSSQMGIPICAIRWLTRSCKSMECGTAHHSHTIHRKMGKQRYRIVKSSPLWRKKSTAQGRIGRKRLRMHSGHIGQHLKHHWVCVHSESFMGKHATCQWNWSIAYWATQMLNMDSNMFGEKQMLQLSELDEFRNEANENARIY